MASLTNAVLIEPTFSMYRKCLNAHKRRILSLDLNDDFTLDLDMVQDALDGSNEVVFLCSPNNPSGNQFSRDEVRTLLESTSGFLVLDEAYVEFSGESLVGMTKEYQNLIVLRTFSKAFGIAGLRVGYAVMNRKLAEKTRSTLLLPYPVCTVSLKVAMILLERYEEVSQSRADVQRTREQLCQELRKLPDITVYPSVTNFLLLEVTQPSRLLVESMQQLGIKIRDVEWVNTGRNLVRVTVPPYDELNRVVGCFKEVLIQ
jgi:histidinol-phosphate aminotransferase